jgi:hypothetical protein
MSEPRPSVTFAEFGRDGNAYAIMGVVTNALRRAHASREYIDKYYEEATAGDYDNLLQVSMRYVNVGGNDDEYGYEDEEETDD